jgi:hypothetical protein
MSLHALRPNHLGNPQLIGSDYSNARQRRHSVMARIVNSKRMGDASEIHGAILM